MASKRKRKDSWEYCIRRKHTLPKPIYLTFKDEAEGDAYVARLEKAIDAGIIPEQFKRDKAQTDTLYNLFKQYLNNVTISPSDQKLINVLVERLRHTRVAEINYEWAETWVASMKADNLSPVTIRHYVGALARCFDYFQRKGLLVNPLRLLPKRYATVENTKSEVHRDRRLTDDEIELILAHLPDPELKQIFCIALETAMRLREIYTLSLDQIDLEQRTIFLDRTKNGDKRQVPLSSIACNFLTDYLKERDLGAYQKSHLFPSYYSGIEDLEKTTGKLSKKFQRIFKKAGVHDFRFHDIRHHATCQFFLRTNLSDLEIATITGHSNPRILKRYANLRGSELASKLW